MSFAVGEGVTASVGTFIVKCIHIVINRKARHCQFADFIVKVKNFQEI